MIEALIKETNRRKDFEFFDISPRSSALPRAPQSLEKRLQGWYSVFGEMNPYTGKKELPKSVIIERTENQPDLLSLTFPNGLRIEDAGDTVSFWAAQDKSSVEQKSALSTIRQAANHLYRRDSRLEVGNIYSGSAPYVTAFEEAQKEARKFVNQEEIAKLAQNKR